MDSHYPFGIFQPLCFLFFLDLRILITPLVSFGHCVVCSSQIYGFSLPLWYLLSIVLSVLLRFTDSHYPFGIFCPLCCLFFLDLRILITPLVSFVHCVVCSSQIYGFSFPLWYLLAIVLSVLLRFTDSHYPFGIFCPLCCLFFLDLRILITPLVSFVHCVVCSSQIYGFSLPLWYLLSIVLSVLLRFMDSHYPFGIFCPLCYLFFLDLRILITPLVSFGHCDFCSSQIDGFSLPLWYLFAIVLSVLLRFTDSHFPFGIFWPLCFLFFLDLRNLITPLVSFGHCVFCSSQTYAFSLPLWYLLAIVLSVLPRFTDSHYPFGIFCPLCCLFFLDLRILISPLVSFGHCVVCSSQIYGFSLPLWYLLSIVLSVLLRFTDSHYPFGILWSLCCLFFLDLRILISPLVSFCHCAFCSSEIYGFSLPLWYLLAIVLSVLLRFTDSHYPFGIFCPLCCLFFLDLLILITPLVSFDHCVVCSSQIYGFSLPLWYLLTIVLSVLLRFTDSHYPFGIFCPLCCLFLDLLILITPLVSFVHCVVCSSQIYGFSLPLWYLLSIVLSVLLRFKDSHYPFGIFCPLCCLFFSLDLLEISLPLWYLLAIVLSVLLRFTDSHYPFGIFQPLCFMFFLDLRILITPLVSFGHCVFCSSQIYRFSLPLWYLLVIVLSVLLRFTDSHYPFGIFCPLCCLFFLDLRILITPLVSFVHCVVCSSQIYGFSLPLWYLLSIVLSVLLRFTDSHYPFGIFCPLCCLFFLDLRILITPLVSFVHCVVCSSQIYGFSLPLWYLLANVFSVLLRVTHSHYPFGICCPLCCLFFLDLRILITPLVSFVHCVVCSSQVYGFSFPL